MTALTDYATPFEVDLHHGMTPRIVNGFCQLSDRPGLGTVLDKKVAQRKPYVPLSRSSEARAF